MPVIDTEHPSFARPEESAQLWRYVDLAKYLSLLTTRSLWFSRADLLGDPFEGSVSAANIRLRPALYRDQIPEHALHVMQESRRLAIRHHYVSCWHRSEWESAAMWRLYISGHGIALSTNYGRMREALGGEEHIFVGHVRYVDYERHWIPEGNGFDPYLHKRRSFAHEQEVRAVIATYPTRPEPTAENGEVLDYGLPSPAGLAIPTDPASLIEGVYVAPDAPSWFVELVGDVTARLGYGFGVSQSELSRDPVY